jgi:hypothetical protein
MSREGTQSLDLKHITELLQKLTLDAAERERQASERDKKLQEQLDELKREVETKREVKFDYKRNIHELVEDSDSPTGEDELEEFSTTPQKGRPRHILKPEETPPSVSQARTTAHSAGVLGAEYKELVAQVIPFDGTSKCDPYSYIKSIEVLSEAKGLGADDAMAKARLFRLYLKPGSLAAGWASIYENLPYPQLEAAFKSRFMGYEYRDKLNEELELPQGRTSDLVFVERKLVLISKLTKLHPAGSLSGSIKMEYLGKGANPTLLAAIRKYEMKLRQRHGDKGDELYLAVVAKLLTMLEAMGGNCGGVQPIKVMAVQPPAHTNPAHPSVPRNTRESGFGRRWAYMNGAVVPEGTRFEVYRNQVRGEFGPTWADVCGQCGSMHSRNWTCSPRTLPPYLAELFEKAKSAANEFKLPQKNV